MRPAAFVLVLSLSLPGVYARCGAQNISTLIDTERQHDTPEWANIAAHLPDPSTASPGQLELAGDVLRARRYDGDALRFYNAALQRGGNQQVLTKKMGVTCLEMQQPLLARMYFQRSLRLNKKDPVSWNDLGASEFTLQDNRGALSAYKHALKLDKNSAVYHSNLALVYFETNDMESARRQLATAMRLDPDLLHKRNEMGYSAQLLATTRYAEICFEMARIYGSQGNMVAMLDWLTKASERGYDVRAAMDRDSVLRPMMIDPRVQVILKNAKLLRAGNKAPATNIPSLGTIRQ